MKLHNRSPLIVPWWVLTTIYIGFIVLGTAAIVFGSPTLDLTTPGGYTVFWGIAVTLSAVGAVVGSTSPHREALERWSSTVLVSVILSWTVSAFVLLFVGGSESWSRATFTIIVLMVTALPGVRVAYLLRRSGVKAE